MYKHLILLCIVFLIAPLCLKADNNIYPNAKRLFYVERSKNKNMVCYDVNTTASGAVNKDNPVNVYWINREERMGERNTLSLIQQRLAYGYKVLNKNTSQIEIALNATKNRAMKLKHDSKLGYICVAAINNQQARLYKVFVKTKTPNSITVDYVEIIGYSLASGKIISEKIYK